MTANRSRCLTDRGRGRAPDERGVGAGATNTPTASGASRFRSRHQLVDEMRALAHANDGELNAIRLRQMGAGERAPGIVMRARQN